MISWWSMKIFERCFSKRLVLSRSERANNPSAFLIEQENFCNLRKFLVVFHSEPSWVYKDLKFVSKSSFLNFWFSFLKMLDKLLKVDLSEDSLDLCHQERVLCFSVIKIFIFGGKIKDFSFE